MGVTCGRSQARKLLANWRMTNGNDKTAEGWSDLDTVIERIEIKNQQTAEVKEGEMGPLQPSGG
eukprot:924349-Prorocentrum_minimum.AAC.2